MQNEIHPKNIKSLLEIADSPRHYARKAAKNGKDTFEFMEGLCDTLAALVRALVCLRPPDQAPDDGSLLLVWNTNNEVSIRLAYTIRGDPYVKGYIPMPPFIKEKKK